LRVIIIVTVAAEGCGVDVNPHRMSQAYEVHALYIVYTYH